MIIIGRDIKKCNPELQIKAEKLVSACKGQGLITGIGECYRTVEEQDALYAKGRTAPGNIVTYAKGSSFSSHHQWGTAFDIYRNDGKGAYNDSDGFFSRVGEIGRKLGLEWGGDWESPVDKPHFQLPYWGSTTEGLKGKYGSPEGFKKTWDNKKITETEVEEKMEKVYNSVEELPQWEKGTIQKLLDMGYLYGDENGLGLTETAVKVFTVNDRAGLYR